MRYMLAKGPYNPQQEEPRILKFWLDNKFFKPEYIPGKGLVGFEEMKRDQREPFCIVNPPPNAYMRPHIGNVSGYAYQDVFLRFNRMLGKKVLGQPGKDHAGIQGEVVLERIFLENKKLTKAQMGREKFYKSAYAHFTKLMPKVMEDEQRIGLSSDYDRNIFTLDPKIVNVILGTFIKMFENKMVYKGVRIVNWDPVAKTTLADIDTEHKERQTELVYIKYPFADGNTKDGIIVATTRAETMLGDTAVAVNPKDKRYTGLIGKKLTLPLTNREIPIISSPRVDIKFGTGAVKLTPAHSYDDYIIMNEWNTSNPDKKIGYINIIDKKALMTGPIAEKYKGLTTIDCRKQVEHDLGDLVTKREKHNQSIIIGERSKAVIEQIMSSQWFVDVEKLKDPALEAVRNGSIKIHPESMVKKYEIWLNNLHDWPISRSLWWGYRIPVWYKGEVSEFIDPEGQVSEKIADRVFKDIQDAFKNGYIKVQIDSPGEGWIQDENVFDTWFSSGQWPYATLIANDLLHTFFPTDVMETGYDILELWVSRMIMLSLYHEHKIPFKHVYLHGLVKAPDGQKMSKSKNNVIESGGIIDKYGADSLRLMYIVGNKAGAGYPVSYEKLEGYKRFLNKIWNASKFVLNAVSDLDINKVTELKKQDKEFLKELEQLRDKVIKHIEKFQIGFAAELLYQHFWHNFCDIFIEKVKSRTYLKDRDGNIVNNSGKALASRKSAQTALLKALKMYLIMLHPFIPFVTEAVWQEVPKNGKEYKTIMYSNWIA